MRIVCTAAATALVMTLALAAQASAPSTQGSNMTLAAESIPLRLSQNLPSDVEQRMGIRPNSSDRNRRGGVPSDVEQRYRRGGVPSDVEQHRYRAGPSGYFGDRRSHCERRADQRGLDGREFRRYVRWCLDR